MSALLVGIDTESDNQWDAAARARPTFENLYAVPDLHALFRRHGVRPTYLITHPVASDPRSADLLRSLRESGTCEIGAHHHAWETPPCTADDVARHAYASWLPLERFDAQLASLTDAIEQAVGERPLSYRSGRFGFAAAHTAGLERLGYLVDSTLTEEAKAIEVQFGSEAYFDLITLRPDLRKALAASRFIVVMVSPDTAIVVRSEGGVEKFDEEMREEIKAGAPKR